MQDFHISNQHLSLTLTKHDKHLSLTLTDQATGTVWGPSPLVIPEVYSKAEFRVEPLPAYRIDAVETLPDGFHVIFGDAFRGWRAALWLRLDGEELAIRLSMPEVYEDSPHRYRLFNLAILPNLLRATAEGQMFLPLNTGALSSPKDKPAIADRFMIYGEQSRWELLPTMPVIGVMNPDGGLMALATQGAGETACDARTDGQGTGTIAFGMTLRQFWPDPVEFATREIRFRPIAKDADFLLALAKRLRRHVMDDLGKPTLKTRCAESPELAYMMRAYTMKLFFAVENVGIMMHGAQKGSPITFRTVMTFDECAAALQRIHAAGLPEVYTQMVGFNPCGHDGMFPTMFPIDERLGGEAKFRELIALGNGLGFRMNVHDNPLAMYARSPEFDPESVVHDQWGEPMGLGEWGGGVNHVYNINVLTDEQILARMRTLKDLGLEGMGYLDGMGNPLYRDYHPRHRLTRTGYAEITNRLIRLAKQVHGAAGTECGFLYCAVVADSLCSGGAEWIWKACWKDWPATALMDRRVPVWKLAMHGLVFLENQSLSWQGAMESVLMGEHPRDEWSTRPGVMPVIDDARIARQKAVYDVALAQFGHLQAEELVAWSEPAPGVQATRFADGTEVTADFGTKTLTVNGAPIPCPPALRG